MSWNKKKSNRWARTWTTVYMSNFSLAEWNKISENVFLIHHWGLSIDLWGAQLLLLHAPLPRIMNKPFFPLFPVFSIMLLVLALTLQKRSGSSSQLDMAARGAWELQIILLQITIKSEITHDVTLKNILRTSSLCGSANSHIISTFLD